MRAPLPPRCLEPRVHGRAVAAWAARGAAVALVGLTALGCGGSSADPDAAIERDAGLDVSIEDAAREDAGAPRTAHCALDPSCPELPIEGDPHAVSPFRGHGDPSLERDPSTGDLWLSYSWLEARLEMGETEPDLTVVTHLARSDDDGRTFAFVRAVNSTEVVDGPSGGRGFWLHEVSSLSRGEGEWRLAWLDYLDPVGAGERAFFHLARTTASEPALLGESVERWVGVAAGVAPLTVTHDVSSIAGLEDCATLTEPALCHHDGADWLAASCVVVDASGRHPERERLVLLREAAGSLELVGTLFDARDAAALGASRIEQIDLSIARDGSVIAIVTPIVDGGDPLHRGCVVFDVEDLATARLSRDADGRALPRLVITADGTVFGPGLCTYDAASETGILLVITDFDLGLSPPRLLFSLRATGLHP